MYKYFTLKIISILTTISGFFVLTWLILNKDFLSLFEKPLSAIGNLPSNYLIFLFGSGIVFYFLFIFLLKIYINEKMKISWELYALPVLILLTLIIPYNDEQLVAKILHTTAGVLGALLIIFIMYKVNKFYFPKSNVINKITKNIPSITFVGTLTLFFALGLNTVMQLFYLGLSLIWINLVAFSTVRKKKK